MKRVCLYSMHFVLCVLCICTMALVLSGCSGRNEKQTGVADRMSGESEKRGYNPEMAFDYDEHEDIEVDDNYVSSLCSEAVRELEVMFGPAEFYIRAENSGEDSYTLNIMYNGKAAERTFLIIIRSGFSIE